MMTNARNKHEALSTKSETNSNDPMTNIPNHWISGLEFEQF
jgi:hypothetical protein